MTMRDAVPFLKTKSIKRFVMAYVRPSLNGNSNFHTTALAFFQRHRWSRVFDLMFRPHRCSSSKRLAAASKA
jgi:hypothetical protein